MTTYTLPWPPSVNGCWKPKRGGGVYLSKNAAKFRSDAIAEILQQGRRRFDGPVSVDIVLHPPTAAKYDIDNFNKAILDALTHAGVWNDDHQVYVLKNTRGGVRKGGEVVVDIIPLQIISSGATELGDQE